MARQKVYTDHVFDTKAKAEKYIKDHYSPEKNYIMRNAQKAGKKVSVEVEKRGRSNSGSDIHFVIVIVVG
jgi:hypothetical protein